MEVPAKDRSFSWTAEVALSNNSVYSEGDNWAEVDIWDSVQDVDW